MTGDPARGEDGAMDTDGDLIEQYRIIHETRSYGRSSEVLTGLVMKEIETLEPKRILDFGCGQSRLVDWLGAITGAEALRYDPAIPEHARMPCESADVILCTDVLEHVPEGELRALFERMRSISPNVYFNVSCAPAREVLPDGRNAHCTVKPPQWWMRRIRRAFGTSRRARSLSQTAVTICTW